MDFDLNAAIVVYSRSMGNRADALTQHCAENGIAELEARIKETIDTIQQGVFERVWEKTRDEGPLTDAQIVELATDYCRDHAPSVDDAGMNGLLQWVIWMAWHEGCLK